MGDRFAGSVLMTDEDVRRLHDTAATAAAGMAAGVMLECAARALGDFAGSIRQLADSPAVAAYIPTGAGRKVLLAVADDADSRAAAFRRQAREKAAAAESPAP